eukprot:1138366-Pelagomonas_calceolata.AAC.1
MAQGAAWILWGTHSCLGTKSACRLCKSERADTTGDAPDENEGRRLRDAGGGTLLTTRTSCCPEKH